MLSRLFLVFGSLALLLGAGLAGQREFAAQAVVAGNDSSFFERMAAGPSQLPLSNRVADAVMQKCVAVVGGVYGALQPPELTKRARIQCLAMAGELVEQMPSYALGWYSRAMFSYQLDDFPDADAQLVMAQQVGRHEQWIAEGRVQLAEQHYGALSSAALAGHQADLTLLAQSARGIRSIAYRYVAEPDFRERITKVVEALPPQDQSRFISNVRAAAERFGLAGTPQ